MTYWYSKRGATRKADLAQGREDWSKTRGKSLVFFFNFARNVVLPCFQMPQVPREAP